MTDTNTILHIHFDDIIEDVSPNLHQISVLGNVSVQNGHFDKVGIFDGSGDFITVPDHADFNIGGGDFTYECFVNFSTVQTTMFFKQEAGAEHISLQYYKDATHSMVSFQCYSGGVNTVLCNINWSPMVDTVYHLAFEKHGSTYTLYINGQAIGTHVDASPLPNPSGSIFIGAEPNGTRSLSGWMNELRISNVARFQENFTPPTSAYDDYEQPPAPTPQTPLTPAEQKHFEWQINAAFLDPAGFVHVRGLFDLTVPAGKGWVIANAWFVNSGNGGANFHRRLGLQNAKYVPPGTRIKGINAASLLHYLDLDSVINGDARYDDPENLYRERMGKIAVCERFDLNMYRPAGTTQQATTSFPTDFENGILLNFSTHGGCWITVDGGSGGGIPQNIVNTWDEISDGHEIRFTAPLMQPFKRSMFDRATLGLGNRPGIYAQPHTEDTFGVLEYIKIDDCNPW